MLSNDTIKNGVGIYTNQESTIFEGIFKNDMLEGYGIMLEIKDRKAFYKGFWKNNLFDG